MGWLCFVVLVDVVVLLGFVMFGDVVGHLCGGGGVVVGHRGNLQPDGGREAS